jgi:hypothetical protein
MSRHPLLDRRVILQAALALVSGLCLSSNPVAGLAPQEGPPVTVDPDETLRFAVLGHVRGLDDGSLYYQLDELIAEVAAAEPAFVVLTGDIIWGDVTAEEVDSARVVAEWEAIDDTLRVIGAPVYRTPGNHDISDLVTRDIYFGRYGDPQRVFDVGRNRFIIISSSWIPEDGDTRRNRRVRGRNLDSAQIAFLRENLPGDDSYDRAFVFMHSLLWWQPDDGPWWQEVHPILADGKVRAVFSGDYGPTKYSYRERDGVEYYQSGVAPDPGVEILRGHEWNRVLAQQFDNWVLVTIDGSSVDIDIETIGETDSGGHWTPDRWRDVYGGIRRPPRPGPRDYFDSLVGTPRGLYAVIAALVVAFLAGVLAATVVVIGRRRNG